MRELQSQGIQSEYSGDGCDVTRWLGGPLQRRNDSQADDSAA